MKRISFLAILLLVPLLLVLVQYETPEQEETFEFLVIADDDFEECEIDPDCDAENLPDMTPENFLEEFSNNDDLYNSCLNVYKLYEFYQDYPLIVELTQERLQELDCYFLEI